MTPTDVEGATGWWQGSRRYFDGADDLDLPVFHDRDASPHPEASPPSPPCATKKARVHSSSPSSPPVVLPHLSTNEIGLLRDQVRALVEENVAMRDRVSPLEEEVRALKEVVCTLGEENDALRDRVSPLEEEVRALSERVFHDEQDYSEPYQSSKFRSRDTVFPVRRGEPPFGGSADGDDAEIPRVSVSRPYGAGAI